MGKKEKTEKVMAANDGPFDQASTNYKEAFALFDKRGNQRVALESLGDLLRACGQNPTLAEIRELEKGVGSDCMYLPPTFYLSSLSQHESKEKRREEKRGGKRARLTHDSRL